MKEPRLAILLFGLINILAINCEGVFALEGAVHYEHENSAISFQDDKIPESMNQTQGCGGVLVANRGFIGYSMNETYNNNERCIWTVRTDRVVTMIHMRWQGFAEEDFISVYTMNKTGALHFNRKITKNSGNQIFEFQGPVIFLTFTSDQHTVGTGFYLEYFGFAYRETTGYIFNHFQLEGQSGTVSYPPPDYPTNEMVTYMINPVLNKMVKVNIGHVDVGRMYAGCSYNYFSVHQLFLTTFELRLRYCEPELDNTAIIRSSSPILITFFATTSPQQTGFSFSWELIEK